MSLGGLIGFVVLGGAVAVGVTRRGKKRRAEPTVHRMIRADGPVESFNVSSRPSRARIKARGEALAFSVARLHMAGPGGAWFEPESPLVFELDSGDIHVIPREYITKVERCDGEESHGPDEQPLMITLVGYPLFGVTVCSKLADMDKWAELPAAND